MDQNYINLIKYRESMYRLFSNLYIEEINKDTLNKLIKLRLPKIAKPEQNWQLEFNAGFDLMESYLEGYKDKSEEEIEQKLEYLAADYAKIFLAAGEATGHAAFPYESVYVGHDSELGGSVRDNLAALFNARGFGLKADMFEINADHIGLIFNYMAELIAVQIDALSKDEEDVSKGTVFDQKTFFNDHIKNWVNLFTGDVYKYADTDFYKGLARMTTGFLGFDQLLIRDKKFI